MEHCLQKESAASQGDEDPSLCASAQFLAGSCCILVFGACQFLSTLRNSGFRFPLAMRA